MAGARDNATGGAGNEILNGGLGDDTMSGGSGDEIFYVNSTSDQILEAANRGIDTVATSVTYALSAGG